jgi:hypothetical protein
MVPSKEDIPFAELELLKTAVSNACSKEEASCWFEDSSGTSCAARAAAEVVTEWGLQGTEAFGVIC